MPLPASIRAGEGRLSIADDFAITAARGSYTEPRLDRAMQRLQGRVARLTGVAVRDAGPGTLLVRVAGPGSTVQSAGDDESYRLEVAPLQAVITAPTPLGAMHGLETFYQLLENTPPGWSAAAVIIEDHPRFPWRGLLLDVSRHFMPVDIVLRTLDGMAAVKLNVFHWHLSDDQGFRVESARFPRLHELGSDGLYYTQQQIRDVVEYARDRGIRVVPEFDMPGHAASWLVGYPELAAGPGPFRITRTWGISDPAMDPAKPELYTFLDRFIGEMAALFPDACFHIGGDEVNGAQWNANTTDIPAFMQIESLRTTHDLQAYFNRQLERIVAGHGKRMEGWDEILHPELPKLPKNVVIQSWRGAKTLAAAARQGYQTILSAGYYLDHMQSAAKLYLTDPAGGLANARMVLGGEICMWSEYVSPDNVDSRVWPRSAAVAERLWSQGSVRSVPDMYRRLELISAELDQLGLLHNSNYRTMLGRLAGSNESLQDTGPLQVLADVLEPGSLGLRHRVNPNYVQSTPLDRLVDAARPDSGAARHFSELVDRWLARKNDRFAREEIRRWLALWAGNDAKLQPLLARRPILREAMPVSQALAKMAAAALAGSPSPAAMPSTVGELNIAVAAAIRRLAGNHL